MSWNCFYLEATNIAYRWLRRYEYGDCSLQPDSKPEHRYHCGMVKIEDTVAIPKTHEHGSVSYSIEPNEWTHDDARWPKTCACGHMFSDKAEWQLFYNIAWKDKDGKLWSIHLSELPGVERAGIGAMWNAGWMPEKRKNQDGLCLVVRCPRKPDGTGVSDWMIDGPSLNGNGWTRTARLRSLRLIRASSLIRQTAGMDG
jgi:hypothetical protein